MIIIWCVVGVDEEEEDDNNNNMVLWMRMRRRMTMIIIIWGTGTHLERPAALRDGGGLLLPRQHDLALDEVPAVCRSNSINRSLASVHCPHNNYNNNDNDDDNNIGGRTGEREVDHGRPVDGHQVVDQVAALLHNNNNDNDCVSHLSVIMII